MKKVNMIIGKKQIVLASLVLILAGAVYVNWIFSGTDAKDFDITGKLEEGKVTQTQTIFNPEEAEQTGLELENEETTQVKNLGETELVNAKSVMAEDYFALASLAKLQARDEAIDTISLVLNDENADEESRAALAQKAMQISDDIEAETTIENLIKSKGFTECMVYLNGESASVVVKCDEMDSVKATQIKELVLSESNILAENISVIDLK